MTRNTETMMVAISEKTVSLLFDLRNAQNESLTNVIERLAAMEFGKTELKQKTANDQQVDHGRYILQIFGETTLTKTLPEALCFALNKLADLDGSFLEKLARTGGHKRTNVARSKYDIHLGRDDLNERNTLEFRQGWWVGTNYSYTDVRRIFRDMCGISGLEFDNDIRFQKRGIL